MKDNRISIQISKPVKEVFSFTLNPQNTPKWIDSIVHEEASESPARKGTVYKNQNRNGEWSEYCISEFKENEMFTLTKNDNNYHVRYILKPVNITTTELEYYEWVNEGDLEDSFTLDILKKLKAFIENMTNEKR